MQIKPDFYSAVEDYLLLMDKKYPQKATLKLVSDKYRLTSIERSILFRGVVTTKNVILRKPKITGHLPENGMISIDGFNVSRTVASYLLGRPVYIAMDGFIRDASEMHGKPLSQEWRFKAFGLMLDLLKAGDYNLEIWLDSPVSKSGETAAMINKILREENIKGKAETVHSADYQLKQVKNGIVATADSAIIENANVPVIDLAQLILKNNYNLDLFDLRTFISA